MDMLLILQVLRKSLKGQIKVIWMNLSELGDELENYSNLFKSDQEIKKILKILKRQFLLRYFKC